MKRLLRGLGSGHGPKKVGRPRMLPDEDENDLVQWVGSMRDAGWLVTRTRFLSAVRVVALDRATTKQQKDKIRKKNLESWYKGFRKRHQMKLSTRSVRPHTVTRAAHASHKEVATHARLWHSVCQQFKIIVDSQVRMNENSSTITIIIC